MSDPNMWANRNMGVSARPVNNERQRQIKARTHALCWGLIVGWWLLIFLSVNIGMHAAGDNAPQIGSWAAGIATVCLPFVFCASLPFAIWFARRSLREHTQDDIPNVPQPKTLDRLRDPEAYPEIKRDRSKLTHVRPGLLGSTAFQVKDYPMVDLLDEDWIAKYRYRTDEDIPQCISDMCSEVLHNWNVAHPNAPESAKKPAWFESMDEQAACLLEELRTKEAIVMGMPGGISDEEYFRRNLRWPDAWYARKGLPVPPPGPDPDWHVPNVAAAAASAAIIAGAAVYMGAWKPYKALKKGL